MLRSTSSASTSSRNHSLDFIHSFGYTQIRGSSIISEVVDMKRILWLAVFLALVIIALGMTGCEGITSPIPRTTTTSPVTGQNTGIWVTGEGKVSVVPDVAILSLGVEAQADTVAQAQNEANSAMDAVTRELDSHGVADKDIKTQHFSISPVRRWVQEKETEVLVGYRVNNMVTAKVRKVENTATIIDAVARAGGDYIRIDSISFTVDDPTPYHKEVREKAMADAKTKAGQLADSAGVKLGAPTYISESGGATPITRVSYGEAMAAPVPAAAPPISPGETDIVLTVQVAYSIR
jgi:uncharacterized protein YggE